DQRKTVVGPDPKVTVRSGRSCIDRPTSATRSRGEARDGETASQNCWWVKRRWVIAATRYFSAIARRSVHERAGAPWAASGGSVTSSSRTGSHRRTAASLGEELRGIAERLELQRVARGIGEEHRRLLADLAGEADARFDDEAHPGGAQVIRERMPRRPVEHDPEVADGDGVAVDGVRRRGAHLLGGEMGDDLVTVQVEIDPLVRGAALRAAEEAAIEGAGGGEVV